MRIREIKDVPYHHYDGHSSRTTEDEEEDSPIDPLRTLDLYFSEGGDDIDASSAHHQPEPAPILIVFIHGGAWRSGDKSQHGILARQWASLDLLPHDLSSSSSLSPKRTGVVVAVPNYRLSPIVNHPVHTRDIHEALQFLLEGETSSSDALSAGSSLGPSSRTSEPKARSGVEGSRRRTIPKFSYSQIWIAGHSAGAHIAGSLVLSSPPSLAAAVGVNPKDSSSTLRRITGVIGIEGIYNIDRLLESFPSTFYRTFIEEAFGTRPLAPPPSLSLSSRPYEDVDATSYILPRHPFNTADHLQWAIIHSRYDTLVDLVQAETMAAHLEELYNSNNNDENNKGRRVVWEYERVRGEHDELLDSEALAEVVADVIMRRL